VRVTAKGGYAGIMPDGSGVYTIGLGLLRRSLVTTAKFVSIVTMAMIQAMTQTYAQTGALREPIARVEMDGKWGFIATNGEYAFDRRFDGAGTFSEGLAEVKVGGKWGYIDETGRPVITPHLDGAGEFSEGLANVTMAGQDGFIDRTGGVVIKPQFDHAWGLFCGLGMVEADHKRWVHR
jgi:hypothetical protein